MRERDTLCLCIFYVRSVLMCVCVSDVSVCVCVCVCVCVYMTIYLCVYCESGEEKEGICFFTSDQQSLRLFKISLVKLC